MRGAKTAGPASRCSPHGRRRAPEVAPLVRSASGRPEATLRTPGGTPARRVADRTLADGPARAPARRCSDDPPSSSRRRPTGSSNPPTARRNPANAEALPAAGSSALLLEPGITRGSATRPRPWRQIRVPASTGRCHLRRRAGRETDAPLEQARGAKRPPPSRPSRARGPPPTAHARRPGGCPRPRRRWHRSGTVDGPRKASVLAKKTQVCLWMHRRCWDEPFRTHPHRGRVAQRHAGAWASPRTSCRRSVAADVGRAANLPCDELSGAAECPDADGLGDPDETRRAGRGGLLDTSATTTAEVRPRAGGRRRADRPDGRRGRAPFTRGARARATHPASAPAPAHRRPQQRRQPVHVGVLGSARCRAPAATCSAQARSCSASDVSERSSLRRAGHQDLGPLAEMAVDVGMLLDDLGHADGGELEQPAARSQLAAAVVRLRSTRRSPPPTRPRRRGCSPRG